MEAMDATMPFPNKQTVDGLKSVWSGRLVRVKAGAAAELTRFEGRVGRVVTVNYDGRAIVDFADGKGECGWYDVANFEAVLEEVTDDAEKKKYDPTASAAQRVPARQS
ncbi:hypothetical protein FRUB_00748 [Fimbriiglobus ruber]|uniref:Uncharacterized protein n=2 Tax=Fimbriiglobus ruber TaxID=1908690 RepID=A0A225ECI9_9BACT|nr:hypothetical protein FRUB_00748 [Fimbriiglobus ruber]